MPRLALLLSIVSLLVCSSTIAQDNTCQGITQQTLPDLTTALRNNEFSQIETQLARIEEICGYTEFTQRIRVLNLLIQKADTRNEIRLYLDRKFDKQLIKRLESAAEPNYRLLYQRDPQSFDFVPLRHPIDSLVQIKSTAILGSNQYTLNNIEKSLALLFSDHVKTYIDRTDQQTGPRTMTHGPHTRNYSKEGGIYLSTGVYTPLNAVNPIFGTNPMFGVGFISDLEEDYIIDLFFKTRLNNDDRDFEYAFHNDIVWINSSASYLLGGSLGYKFLDMGRFLSIAKVGIASERVNTGLSETMYIDRRFWTESRTRRHRIRTYNLSAGLSVMQHLHGKSFIGLQGQYHYSPYNRDGRVVTPIASDYISFELFFKF